MTPRHAKVWSASERWAHARTTLSKARTKLWTTIIGIGIVVALLTGIFQLVKWFSEAPSGVDSLEVEAATARSGYAIPADAPFDEMPLSFVGNSTFPTCSPELHEWLDRHGRPYDAAFALNMRSTATSGAKMTVKDFTTAGSLSTPSVPWIDVGCVGPPASPVPSQHGQLHTSAGSVAVFTHLGIDSDAAANQLQVGSPVLYELEPGEPAMIVLTLSGDKDFEGSLSVTVASGKDEREVIVPTDDGERIFVPSFDRTKIRAIQIVPPILGDPGLIKCILVGPSGQPTAQTCSGEDIVNLLRDVR